MTYRNLNRHTIVAAVAASLMLTGCGGASAEEPSAAETTTGGAEALAAGAAEASERLDQIDVRLDAESPVGMIPEDEAAEYPIRIVVMNEGDTPVEIEQALARVTVVLEGETVCEAPDFGSVWLVEGVSPRIEPHGETSLMTRLPCGLAEYDDYDVIVDLIFAGEGEDVGVPAPTDPHESASVRISVTEDRPPFQRQRPTPVEVPEGDVSP